MYKCTVWQSYIVDSNGFVYKINEPSISCLEMPKSDSETTDSIISVLPSSYRPIPVSETKTRKDAILQERPKRQKATSTLVGADMLVTKMLHAIQKSTVKPAPQFPHPLTDPSHTPIEQKSNFISPFKPVPAEKNAPSKTPCKFCSCKFDTAAQLSEHVKICNSAHICE